MDQWLHYSLSKLTKMLFIITIFYYISLIVNILQII